MEAVRVTVIAYAPTVFRHCQHCEVAFDEMGLGERIRRDQARDALPEDLALEYARLSDWIHGVIERYRGRVAIDLVDAASVEGIVRSLRHRVRRYPAVVVDGVARRIGVTDFPELDQLIAERLAERERIGPVGGAA
jgi:hypothetical protein